MQAGEGLPDDRLRAFYDPANELTGSMLIDLQSGNEDRGIYGLLLTRQSDTVSVCSDEYHWCNPYVSNGMSAGITRNEARVWDCLKFSNAMKTRNIAETSACQRSWQTLRVTQQ